ncbi:MAG: TetR/AcrR family transcriptional regulator [Oceanospirillaceae bacterium]|nr:TetR/AcrR family transcriptional regulator [Oceanospirillaceae bacterium]
MARGRPSKKQQILDSARALFIERGYQGTTVDLVVQQAGVSKPTVYSHFASKQVLWQAMLEQTIEAAEQQRNAIDAAVDDWLGAILEAYRLLAAQPEMLAVYRIMLGERHKMESGAWQLFDTFEQGLERWCGSVLEAHQAGLDDGQRFVLRALCREGILQPAMRDQEGPDTVRLRALIARAVGVLA